MVELRVGDRVKIRPDCTSCPWKVNPIGRILYLDDDGTAAVEMDGEKLGHRCLGGGYVGEAENGWWFEVAELELIRE